MSADASTNGEEGPPVYPGVILIKQQLRLGEKLKDFIPRAEDKFIEDIAGIRGLTQPPCIKFISKEGKKFWVTRSLLMARCPGLKRSLEQEKASDVLNLDKTASRTLEVLIEYIETGVLHDDWRRMDVVPELLRLAFKYELHVLSDFLRRALVNLCNCQDTEGTTWILWELTWQLGLEEEREEIESWLKASMTNKMKFEKELNRMLKAYLERLDQLRKIRQARSEGGEGDNTMAANN